MDLKTIIREVYGQAGFTVTFFNPDDELDDDCPCTGEPKENTQIFESYEEEYLCAHKDCHNTWTEMIVEKKPILCCGGYAKVCPTCKDKGFCVYDGKGDGRFYLSQHNKEIDNYDFKTAYGLTNEVRDIF